VIQPSDYGLWIGEDADSLLVQYREVVDVAYRTTDTVLDVRGNLAVLMGNVAGLPRGVADSVIMDLLLTVVQLEWAVLHLQLPPGSEVTDVIP
jgi:hypothetical protein